MRKGAIVSASPRVMTSWNSSIKTILYNALLKCHVVKQNAKICAIGEHKGVCIRWTGLLDWTTGLTFELTFERFSFLLL